MRVVYGSSSANGLTFTDAQFWNEDSPEVPSDAQTGDAFGSSLY